VGLVWEKWEIGFKMHSTPHCYPSSAPRNLSQHLLCNPIGYLSAQSDTSSGPPLSYLSFTWKLLLKKGEVFPADAFFWTDDLIYIDHLELFRSIQHQLDGFLRRLIDFVLNERDHVPAITNSDLLPFPVDISIHPCVRA